MSSPIPIARGLCAACARRATPGSASRSASRSISSTAASRSQGLRQSKALSRSMAVTTTTTPRRLFSESPKSPEPAAATHQTQSSSSRAAAQADILSQNPPSHYDLFPHSLPEGPPPKGPFHVDVRALRREFLRLQAAAHPDFHHAASSSSDGKAGSGAGGHSTARAQAERLSARINEAYRTLASPLLRAQYLLRERYGVDLEGDESTTGGSVGAGAGPGAGVADPELLMTVMEAREEIETAGSEAALAGLRAENEARIAASEEALSRAFARDDVGAARAEAVRLRYWVNIRQSVDDWEEGRGVVLQH